MRNLEEISELLRREPWSRPDVEEVLTLGRRRRLQMRLTSAAVVVVVLTFGGVAVPNLLDREKASTIAEQVPQNGPPEGRLLLQVASEARLVDVAGSSRVVARGVDAFSLVSPDLVVATSYRYDDIAREAERDALIHVSATSKQRATLARAGKNEAIGNPATSPDGRRVAFTLTTAQPSRDLLCVTRIVAPAVRCLQQPAGLHSYDWAPDGQSLVAAGDGDLPVYSINADSLDARVLMPSGGSTSIRQAMDQAGYGDALQFVSLSWDTAGRSVASVAMTSKGGAVPIVFDRDGNFLAMGEPNADLPQIVWRPGGGELAYSKGVLGIPVEGFEPGVYLLDIEDGQSTLLLDTRDHPVPWVFDLRWSPSGEWLAVSHESTIGFLRPGQPDSWYTVEVPGVDALNGVGTLRDWEA